ncbi:histone deacetylase [Plakobranchus ocellatus]|uniref:Histone deacetylase n=1 Tax=Plakobranchus ocellatus TaxID=259542 RepID=A0AAV4DLA9_9GAST|nr:histone deacetylase [Plakobranchus ocellatus]
MAAPVEERRTAVVFDKKLESHYSKWNKDFTETPNRVVEILHRCEQLNLLERCLRIPVREATEAEITTWHTKNHLKILESTANMTENELKRISQKYDFIYFHSKSSENAKLTLGGVIDLVEAVVTEKVRNGMAIIRPPGHHAMKEEFCGYCYLGNVSIATQLMLDKYHLQRILVLDWDVHHGQGTQYAFYNDPRVLFVSIHRYEHGREWPNLREGDYDFTGDGPGKGFNINVPLNEIGCDDSDYMAIMFNLLLPIFYQGEMSVEPACFAHFVNLLMPLAKGKIAIILEGGYNLKSLAESAALSLRALLNDPTPTIAPIISPKHSVAESILNCIKVLHHYWPCLQYQDFVEAHKVKAEAYPYQGVLHLPPVKDVEFYTSQNRPEFFPLIQECADDITLERQAELDQIIGHLIESTSLVVPKHRISVVFQDEDSPVLGSLKTSRIFSSCLCLQDSLSLPNSVSDCIRASLDSVLTNEAQCSLCCLHSSSNHSTLNGAAVNGNSEPNIISTIVQCSLDSSALNSVLYLGLRPSHQESEDPSVSQNMVDIPLAQASVLPTKIDSFTAVNLISVFFQVVLPIAYEYCPQLVVFKILDLEFSKKHIGRSYLGLLTQLLLGLAGGRLLLLTRDATEAGSRLNEAPSSGSSVSADRASDGEGSNSRQTSALINKQQSKEGDDVAAWELLEECLGIIQGNPCRTVKVDPPSNNTVTTIKKAQDRLKEFWSVFQFRVQLPIVSL